MCNVNIATGEVTQFEFDVVLSGRIPWLLIRRYSSENPELGVIGFGWKLNLGTFLRCAADQIEMVVDGESSARFPLIGVGQLRPLDDSGVAVARTDAGISVTDRTGNTYVFPCGDPLPNVALCVRRYDHYRNFVEYRYDGDARLKTLIDTFNRQIVFAYDGRSRLVEIYAATGNGRSSRWPLVHYEYDDQDDLVAVLDPNGRATRYEYASHLLTRVTDPNGRDLFYQYDRNKKCIRTWFTGGVWDRQLWHDPVRQRVLLTNPDGHPKLYKHNGKGTITGDVDALGRVRDDVVDQNGQLLLRAGPGGAAPTVIQRNPGSRTVLLSQNGRETVAEVDANDQVTLMKSPDGNVWKYEYDPAGNEIRSEDPDGAVWLYDYNEHGDLVRYVDPIGYERYRESAADRLMLRDQWGVRQDERFDYFGRSTSIIDGADGEIRIEYDPAGRPVRRTSPDGTSSSMEYDPAGRPNRFTDELGSQVCLVRDLADRSIKVLRPDGHEELFEYGLTDELRRVTNSKGEVAEFTYDAAGRCSPITYFDGRRHAIVYDDADHPLTLQDGRTGKVLAECKYQDDALVEESYFDGRRLKIGYGPSEEVVSVENDDASLSYEWNPLMRIVAARKDGLELNYDYNLRGDNTALTASTGRRIEYEWDGRGRLVRMIDSASGTYEYSYQTRDLVTEIRMPNGCSQSLKYRPQVSDDLSSCRASRRLTDLCAGVHIRRGRSNDSLCG